MKIKRKFKIKKIRTHEEKAIDDIFDDGELEPSPSRTASRLDYSIETAPPENKIEETFDYVDYLDNPQSMELWEDKGKIFANELHPYVVTVMSSFDAILNVEAHLSKEAKGKVSLLHQGVVSDLSNLLELKLKVMVLKSLEFSKAQETEIFAKIVEKSFSGRSVNNVQDLMNKYLGVDKEMDPYGVPSNGAVSMSKPLRDRS